MKKKILEEEILVLEIKTNNNVLIRKSNLEKGTLVIVEKRGYQLSTIEAKTNKSKNINHQYLQRDKSKNIFNFF